MRSMIFLWAACCIVPLLAQPLPEAMIRLQWQMVGKQIDGRLWGTNLTNESRTAHRTVYDSAFVEAAKQIGIRILRFPGGNNADGYDWKRHEMILPGERKPWTGAITLAEIATFCKNIGAELSLTVNFGSGSPQDAADLVEYCNGPADSRWGRQRVADGFPEPLNVRFFEIGNEINQPHQWFYSWTAEDPYKYFFGGSEERRGNYAASPNLDPIGKKGDVFKAKGGASQVYTLRFPPVKRVDVFWAPTQESAEKGEFEKWRQVSSFEEYGAMDKVYVLDSLDGKLFFGDGIHGYSPPKGSWFLVEYTTYNRPGFLDFARAMRRAPSSVPIQIGAVTVPFRGQQPVASWDSIRMVYEQIDFLVSHQYDAAFPVDRYDYRRQIPYQRTQGPTYGRWRRNQQLVDSFGLQKRLGIAITEWNIFLNEDYWKINRSLEAAVLAAEFFIRLLNAGKDFPVWFAQQFALGGVWLALYNNWTSYTICPMGYVFQGFHPWKGKTVIATTVDSPEAMAYDRQLPYITAAAAQSDAGDTVLLAIVNSAAGDSIRCSLDMGSKTFHRMKIWRLEGDSLHSHNDGNDPYNVVLRGEEIPFTPSLLLAPHSVVFVELYQQSPAAVPVAPHSPFQLLRVNMVGHSRLWNAECTVQKPTSLTVTVYDPLGRYCARVYQGQLPAGQCNIQLHLPPLSRGSYVLIFQTPTKQQAYPITVAP